MAITLASPPVSTRPLRIFLVEDSALVREKLEELLASIEGASNIGHADNADDAIRQIMQMRPDAVVLDIRLAGGSGFDVLRALSQRAPGIAVYMLSNFATTPYRRMAAQLGAIDFFDKTTELDRMRESLRLRARAH